MNPEAPVIATFMPLEYVVQPASSEPRAQRPDVRREVTLSVVSHRQNALINKLLEDIARVCAGRVTLVLTENVMDPVALAAPAAGCPVEAISNRTRRGFGANHNAAFARCRTPYFCVANPDIKMPVDPFPALLAALENPRAGVAAPLVRAPDGHIEDSARRFPTVGRLLRKLWRRRSEPDYRTDTGPIEVDWVAGMFMLFRSEAFAAVSGFDEAYFLYYEDADICRRLLRVGMGTMFVPGSEIVHDARRASRRDPRYARHHAASLLRYLISR
jgi:N-acetylglucosaminyl-diphospho-decaprenol L-rhamnosyltransferase